MALTDVDLKRAREIAAACPPLAAAAREQLRAILADWRPDPPPSLVPEGGDHAA